MIGIEKHALIPIFLIKFFILRYAIWFSGSFIMIGFLKKAALAQADPSDDILF